MENVLLKSCPFYNFDNELISVWIGLSHFANLSGLRATDHWLITEENSENERKPINTLQLITYILVESPAHYNKRVIELTWDRGSLLDFEADLVDALSWKRLRVVSCVIVTSCLNSVAEWSRFIIILGKSVTTVSVWNVNEIWITYVQRSHGKLKPISVWNEASSTGSEMEQLQNCMNEVIQRIHKDGGDLLFFYISLN